MNIKFLTHSHVCISIGRDVSDKAQDTIRRYVEYPNYTFASYSMPHNTSDDFMYRTIPRFIADTIHNLNSEYD